jgi:hypothetical protein
LDLSRSDSYAGQGYTGDPSVVLVCDYTNSSGKFGGVYIDFTSEQDLSAYTSLFFWVKGDAGTKFEICVDYLTGATNDFNAKSAGTKIVNTINTTDTWQLIEYNLGSNGVDKSRVGHPFNLAFSDGITGKSTTMLVDYIYLE